MPTQNGAMDCNTVACYQCVSNYTNPYDMRGEWMIEHLNKWLDSW